MRNQVGGQNKKNEKISSTIYIFFFSNLKAADILDYQTEIFIKNILNTISEVNKYENEMRVVLNCPFHTFEA